ncbi:hypothetical protein IWQ61_008708 [Dispira simplex]|nr:hypothetical protein IWQ61_008708 [Dispira simplex]
MSTQVLMTGSGPTWLDELSQISSTTWILHTTQFMNTIFHMTDPSVTLTTSTLSSGALPGLDLFAKYLVHECAVTNATLLYAIVYARRLHSRLPSNMLSNSEAAHRIFVAALLLASKYLEDSETLSPARIANVLMHWHPLHATWSRIALLGSSARQSTWWAFPTEIARVERAFLKLLDFHLYVSDLEMTEFLPKAATVHGNLS